MKPLITGVVLAIVFLAIMFVVPAFMPRATDSTTIEAEKKAELARRQLHSYDATLPLTAEQSDLEQLKAADLGQMAEKAAEEYAAVQSDFNRTIQGAKKLDQRSGLTTSDLRPMSIGTGAVSTFEKAVRDNDKLLKDAVQNARQATQEDRDRKALSVGQIAGTTKLVEANRVLGEARLQRTTLTTELDRSLNLAVRWAELQALNEHYAGLDLSDVEKSLADDLTEVGAQIEETGNELRDLESSLASTKQTLEGIQAELQQKQTQLADLERNGFDTSDTAAFEAYRAQYEKLSNEMSVLQLREQTLTHGGIEGGTVIGDDLLSGEIQGGTTVVGVDELDRKAAILKVKLERLEKARQALESQHTLTAGLTSESKNQQTSCGEKLQATKAEFDRARAQAEETAKLAFEKEDAALQATRDAASGFKTAKSAADQWKTQARSTQQNYDAPKMNERLKKIINDEYAVSAATSGEAQAKALEGRILTERALGLREQLNVAERIKALMPDAELDIATMQEGFTQAHDTAIETLNAARKMYELLADKSSPTQWVPKSSLATIYHLLWEIDTTNADQHRSNLMDLLGRVVLGKLQFPYIQQQVQLYTALGGSITTPQQPEATPTDEPAPAETPSDEG